LSFFTRSVTSPWASINPLFRLLTMPPQSLANGILSYLLFWIHWCDCRWRNPLMRTKFCDTSLTWLLDWQWLFLPSMSGNNDCWDKIGLPLWWEYTFGMTVGGGLLKSIGNSIFWTPGLTRWHTRRKGRPTGGTDQGRSIDLDSLAITFDGDYTTCVQLDRRETGYFLLFGNKICVWIGKAIGCSHDRWQIRVKDPFWKDPLYFSVV
jgi:hypothetical protein